MAHDEVLALYAHTAVNLAFAGYYVYQDANFS